MRLIFKKIFSFFMSIVMMFPYIGSFMEANTDVDFTINHGSFTQNSVTLNGETTEIEIIGNFEFYDNSIVLKKNASIIFADGKCELFNYFAISYQADAYIKGTLKYIQHGNETSEEFFIKPSEDKFFSFIDSYLDKKKANKIISLSFESLDKDTASIKINGISTFNRKIENEIIYHQNEHLKIGLNLKWGGALSYLEDLNSNVEAIQKNGRIFVDSNASERYSSACINKNVNLINCHDAGRLVQQSYYGTWDGGYDGGEFMGSKWNYNPVQGGNKYNEASKIVDLRIDGNNIYIKCRPLDWSLKKEFITPSYMEAIYTLDADKLNVSCAFTDYSGYPPTITTQEMPAFYCIEPFNYFYYCDNGEIKCKNDLIFWPDAGYPHFPSAENWVAFTGEFEDSFGIGLYVPNGTSFLAGIYDREKTKNKNPSEDVATSYVALVKTLEFKSYGTIEYNYSITTGTINEIRSAFTE